MFDFIIIVPIRDREEHKILFLKEYYPILNDNFSNFKIIFVEQDFKNQYFNRGKILNIGIDLYKNKTKSFVTHDIDVFCPIKILKEYLNSDSEYDVDRIYIGHDSSCGGICKFTHDSIFEVNGFPNYIWGWGIEDRALYNRYKMLSKKISDYKHGPYKNGSDFRRLPHKHNGSNTHPRNKKISDSENEIVNKPLEEQKQHIYNSGLNNLDYDIISRENIADNIEYIKVSIDGSENKPKEMKCCLVTICIGEKYLDQYNSLFKDSQEKYAKKCGYDFKVITGYIGELKHPDLISFNKILVSEYSWNKDYDFIIFVDADIIINENTPPLHSQYEFGDNIGVVNQSQPTLQARHLCQAHKGYEVTASEYYKIKSDLDIETDHIINTGVLVIQPKIHMKFLRAIFDKYSQKQIGHPCKFHYEQSVIGYEIQKANKYYFMDMKWNAIWANNKYYFNTIKKQNLTLCKFYDQNYFIHLAGHCDYNLIPRLCNFELKDEKNCEYVSIRGIAKNCDHFPQSIVSDTNDFDPNDYKCIKENESVFVISSVLDKFVQIILPTLGDIKFKLVTGACVKGVPNEISSIHKNNYIKIFQKNVTRWYTQNFDGTIECVPIPLGIDYHTLQRGNHPWGQMASAKEQERILKEVSNFNFEDKSTRTFSSFHFQLFERHNRDRHRAIDHLKNVKFNDVIKKPVPRKSLWNCMRSYKFIISPHGNGLDCHRTYESILLGSVPVVRSSTLDGLYEGMPVLIIKDWKDLTKEVLEQYKCTGNLEKLKLNYWVSLIKNAQC